MYSAATGRVLDSAYYLTEHLHEVPVHVIPCLKGVLPPGTPAGMTAGFFGSIYPAVWSFQLALRSRGLGTGVLSFRRQRDQPVLVVQIADHEGHR